MKNLETILWVGKQPINDGGDEIYDRKLVEALSKNFLIKRFYIKKQKKLTSLIYALRGTPHPRFNYRNKSIQKSVLENSKNVEHVIVSWESFDFLACAKFQSVTLILHNVMSDALLQIFKNNIVAKLASWQSLIWERAIYKTPRLKIVVLSRRDLRILNEMLPNSQVFVASPGAPPAIPLDKKKFLPEVVISGSYNWYPKRRDLADFCQKYSKFGPRIYFRNDLPFPDGAIYQKLIRDSEKIEPDNFSSGLRVGLIPDSFLGGFKLKSTFYIANNCLVVSMADIREEFSDAPHCEEFVRFIKSVSDLKDIIEEFSQKSPEDLFKRWDIFKKYCMDKFSWENSAEEIAKAITS